MMRILVTGATGFAGSHLVEQLEGEIHGVSRSQVSSRGANIQLHVCELLDQEAVLALLHRVEPNQIYHLAGYAHAGSSFAEPEQAWQDNLRVTRTLYDSIAKWGGRPRILFVGSALVYGEPSSPDLAQDESLPLRPSSPYASSKAAADLLSYQVTQSHGLDVVRVRPFNHIGPRQSPQYAVASFAKQIAEIEHGQKPPVLQTGNLAAGRDLCDVRDMARAYTMLMNMGQKGEVYNAGTGAVSSMREVLDKLVALSNVRVLVTQKPELMRATEVSVIRANPTKLTQCTGWQPRYSLEETLRDTIEYWRSQVLQK